MTHIEDASSRVPEALTEATTDALGRVSVTRRKFGRFGTAFLRMFRIKPDLTVKLDEVGSAVWQLIDGHRSVDQIRLALQEKFPTEPDLSRRLGQYLSTLASAGFVRLR